MEKDNNLDQGFRDAFADFEAAPSGQVWENIEKELVTKKAEKYKKRAGIFQWLAAASLILAISSFTLYLINKQETKKIVENKQQNKIETTNNTQNLKSDDKEKNIDAKNLNKEKYSGGMKESHREIKDNKQAMVDQQGSIASSSERSSISKKQISYVNGQEKSLINESFASSKEEPFLQNDLLADNKVNNNVEKYSADETLSNTKNDLLDNNVMTSLPSEKPVQESSIPQPEILLTQNQEKVTDNLPILSTKENAEDKVNDSTKIKNNTSLAALASDNVKHKLKSKWSFGVVFSPDYSYRLLAANSSDGNGFKNDFNKNETHVFTFSAGGKITYNLSDKWSISSGIYYAVKGQTTNVADNNQEVVDTTKNLIYYSSSLGTYSSPNNTLQQLQVSTSVKSKSSSSLVYLSAADMKETVIAMNYNYTSREKLEFLEIPLLIKYNLVNKRFNFYALAGISTNVLLNARSYVHNIIRDKQTNEMYNDDNVASTVSHFRLIHGGLSFGFGFQYKIIPKLSIGVEPSFRAAITPINKNSSISTFPFVIGIGTSVNYHF